MFALNVNVALVIVPATGVVVQLPSVVLTQAAETDTYSVVLDHVVLVEEPAELVGPGAVGEADESGLKYRHVVVLVEPVAQVLEVDVLGNTVEPLLSPALE